MKKSGTIDEKNSVNSEENEVYIGNIIKTLEKEIEKNKIEIKEGNKNKFFGSFRSYIKSKKSSKEEKFIRDLEEIQKCKKKRKYKGSKYKIRLQTLFEKICKTLKENNDNETYRNIDENIKEIYKSWKIESNEEGNIDHNGVELDHSIIEIKRCLVVLRKRTSLIKSGLIDDIYKSARRGYQLIKVLLGGKRSMILKKLSLEVNKTEAQISEEKVRTIGDIGRILKFLECMIPKAIVKLIINKNLTLSDDDTDKNALNDLYNAFSCLNETIFKKRYKEMNENISKCYEEKTKVSIKSDDDKGKKNCKKIIDYNFNQISSYMEKISKIYSSFGIKDDNFCKDTEKKLKDFMGLVEKYYKNGEESKSKVGKLLSKIKNKFKKSNTPISKGDILTNLKTNLKEITDSVVETRKKFTPNSDNNEFLEKFLIKTPSRMKKFLNKIKNSKTEETNKEISSSKFEKFNELLNYLIKIENCILSLSNIFGFGIKIETEVKAEQYSKIEEMQKDAFGSTFKIGKDTFVKRTGDRLKGKVIFSNFLFATKDLGIPTEDNRNEYIGAEDISQAGDRGVMIIATVEDTSLTKLFKSYKKLVKSGIGDGYSVSHVAEVNIGAKYLNIQSKVNIYVAYTGMALGKTFGNGVPLTISEINNNLTSGKVYFGKSKTHYDLKDKDNNEGKLNYSEFKECIHFLKENSGFSKELKKCLSRIKNHRESASFNKNLVFEDLSYAYNYIRQEPDKLEQYEEELKAELKKLIDLEDKLDDAENQDWEEIKFKIVESEQENEEKNYMSKDKKFKKLETQFRKVREIQQKTKLYSELKRDILTNLSKLCRSMTGYSVEDLSIKEGQEKPSENMEKNQSVIKGDVLSKVPLYIGHKNSINSKNEVLHYEKFLNPGYFWSSVDLVNELALVKVVNFFSNWFSSSNDSNSSSNSNEKNGGASFLKNKINENRIDDRPSADQRTALISELKVTVMGVCEIVLRFYISLKNKYISSFANKFFDVRTKILNGKLEIK